MNNNKSKKILSYLFGLLLSVLVLFLFCDTSSNAETFTLNGKQYDTANAVATYSAGGLQFKEITATDGNPIIYIGGNMTSSSMEYRKYTLERYYDCENIYLYFDCVVKGEFTGYSLAYVVPTVLGVGFGDNFDSTNVTDMSYFFEGFDSITSIDLSKVNTANVKDFFHFFSGCSSLQAVDLSGFDMSKVECTSLMFANCTNLTSITYWNTTMPNLKNAYGMFDYCSKLPSVDMSKFKLSPLESISDFIRGCKSITQIDFSQLEKANLKDISSVVYDCTELKTLNISNLSLPNNVYLNLYSNEKLYEISAYNLVIPEDSNINFPYVMIDSSGEKIKEIEEGTYNTVFKRKTFSFKVDGKEYDTKDAIEYYEAGESGEGYFLLKSESGTSIICIGGDEIDYHAEYIPSEWYEEANEVVICLDSKITSSNSISLSSDKIVGLVTGGDLDTSEYKGSLYGILNLPKVKFIDLEYFDTSNITDFSFTFSDCKSLERVNLKTLDTSNVKNMSYMFSNCSSLTEVDISNIDTKNVTDMSYMFFGCSSLTKVDFSNIDTKNVTDMSCMFFGCSSLTKVDFSNIDTKNVKDMSDMFFGCSSLMEVDISDLDTENVTDMSWMFCDCSSLTKIDLSNFNTKKVTNMSYMFEGCMNLTKLDLKNFNTSNVTNMQSMFYNCSNISSLDLHYFNTSKLENMSDMFRLCINLKTLDASFNTAKVKNFDNIFYGCMRLADLNISNWTAGKDIYIIHTYKLNKITMKNVVLKKQIHLVINMKDEKTGEGYFESVPAGKYNCVLVAGTGKRYIQEGEQVVSGNNVFIAKKSSDGTMGLWYLKSKKSGLTSITIPATVKASDKRTYKVTGIFANAFKGNKTLKTINIGKNVTQIDKNAFLNCVALQTVKGATAVTSIGEASFNGCKKLKTLPSFGKLKTIGNKAFYNCEAITKFTIAASVEKIGKSSFQNCKKLKTLTIKTTKLTDKNVGASAFKSISSTATIKVPKSCLKDYQKLLKKKGINGKKQKIKK